MANKYNAKLSPELSAKLCEALAKGYSIPAACSTVGIVEQTYRNWYNRGREAKSGKYKQFYCDANNAKDKATALAETPIIDAIPTDIKTAQWWLVKHRPDIYADRTYNETRINADVKSEVTVNLLERIKKKRRELDDLNKY